MLSVKSDFTKRQAEIEEYFNFTEVMTDELKNSEINYPSILTGAQEKFIVSDQLQKVLIANGFLLLYNLIEATMRNLLSEIFDRVLDDEADYGQLSENYRNIWIAQSTSNLRANFKTETLAATVKSVVENVLEDIPVILDKTKLDFSGNLDARKIRDLANKYGFTPTSMNAENLLTIKRKRNHLAHGDFSFSDIGKDFSSGDLIMFKEETILFLADVIEQVEIFVDSKKYLRSTGS